ncbi:GDSL-like Lipase/Acylhydrolase superfamily protein [Striga asiatica]|uniref:GDSL-like Lipase/Acylhydrolase superfamily protein n=1 Tax=Striga asiatica TaxID=4170 RepID=A0A5A7QDZ7_STRAF|nr:GDSL-like Lipase/Acylhydrolase superfamily protein [Striga asiatica]
MSLNHNPSPVSLCLKSGHLGFCLPNLLSHHLFGFSTKFFQESSPFAPSTRFSALPTPSPPCDSLGLKNITSNSNFASPSKTQSGARSTQSPFPESLCLKSGLRLNMIRIVRLIVRLLSNRTRDPIALARNSLFHIALDKIEILGHEMELSVTVGEDESRGAHSQLPRNENTILLLNVKGHDLSQIAFEHNGDQQSVTPVATILRNQNRGQAIPIGAGLEMDRGFHAADQIHGVGDPRLERNLYRPRPVDRRTSPFLDRRRKARIGGLLGSEILCHLLG